LVDRCLAVVRVELGEQLPGAALGLALARHGRRAGARMLAQCPVFDLAECSQPGPVFRRVGEEEVRAVLGALIDFGRNDIGELTGGLQRLAEKLLDRWPGLHAWVEALLPARPA